MPLLKPAKMESCYFKYGAYGDAGSGKTHTTSLVAIGLHKYIKSKKPIAFYDSEGGSDYVLHLFEDEGIEVLVVKSRTFADLLATIKEAEKESDIFIADSVTHPWDELCESYKKKHNLDVIRHPAHWQVIKPMWREFSSLYLFSHLHVLVCGRAGMVWEEVEDDQGVKELRPTGMRMRVEKELGYEPSLLIEMERDRASSRQKVGWIHRAWVAKDRFDILDGKAFANPKFDDFLPHIERLNIGGKQQNIKGKSSENLFQKKDFGYQRIKRHEQLLDKIKIIMEEIYPGRGEAEKTNRRKLAKNIFGTPSWEEIKDLDKFDNKDLGKAYKKLSDVQKKMESEELEE